MPSVKEGLLWGSPPKKGGSSPKRGQSVYRALLWSRAGRVRSTRDSNKITPLAILVLHRGLWYIYSMKIYMDACCLNRPFDDQGQDRIRIEAEAVLSILDYCGSGEWELAASKALDFELAQCPDPVRREKIHSLYGIAQNRLPTTAEVEARSLDLQRQGLALFDSLHVALAEACQQDVLLTTDDKLCRTAAAINPGI